jgi:hypothetical protein
MPVIVRVPRDIVEVTVIRLFVNLALRPAQRFDFVRQDPPRRHIRLHFNTGKSLELLMYGRAGHNK